MSLQVQPIPPIPELTVRIARAAFRKGNVYMQMRDLLGMFFADDQFADLYPVDGQPAYAPWRLAPKSTGPDRTPQRTCIAPDNGHLSGTICPSESGPDDPESTARLWINSILRQLTSFPFIPEY